MEEKNKRIQPASPWLPIVERNLSEAQTEHVLRAHKYEKETPILLKDSWTRSVPYKKWFDDATPMENIGSAYTPSASKYRIERLKKPREKDFCPLPCGPDGDLVYPPLEYVRARQLETQEKFAIRSKVIDVEPENVISLAALADDSWFRRKAEKRSAEVLQKKKAHQKRRREMEAKIQAENEVNLFFISQEPFSFRFFNF